MKRLNGFPRVELCCLPTPLQHLAGVSERCGATVYGKRDDLTGFAFGGNKTRKLEYLLGDAISQGVDTLLALGANQSNFCRVAAAAGRRAGLEVHLVLGGGRPKRATGNLLLDHVFGARVHHVEDEGWETWAQAGEQVAAELERAGRSVYSLPVGGSTTVGALGYVRAFLEIMQQAVEGGLRFDAIVHASSSAGTQAGLIVGQSLTGWKGRIIGVSAAFRRERFAPQVLELARATAELLGTTVRPEQIHVDDRQIGPGYGKRTEAGEAAIELFAKRQGILLGPVYSAKAAAGLLELASSDELGPSPTLLFLHTGGDIELFA